LELEGVRTSLGLEPCPPSLRAAGLLSLGRGRGGARSEHELLRLSFREGA
jgi:hypothetical protein